MKKYISYAASLLMASAAIQSCSVEEPFGAGEGIVKFRLKINSDVTRAEMDDDYQASLASNCVIYISKQNNEGKDGLVFKQKGLENLPDQLTLRRGHYVAEAWTGDSVPASFDQKFFRGYQPFDVIEGSTDVELVCKIANVVASVAYQTIDPSVVKDVQVTVSTSNGSLEFTPDNYRSAKGYFMMPFDENGVRESTLNVKVEGKNILGVTFTKTKIVENVKAAHEYVINLNYNPNEDDPTGGGLVTISIDERENLITDTVEIFAAPSIAGVDFDIEKQIVGNPGEFSGDKVVKIVAFNEISSFLVVCRDMASLNLPSQAIDLKRCDDAMVAQLNAAGIVWDKTVEDVEGYDKLKRQLSYLTFSELYLNSLPERATEYQIELTATDGNGKSTTRTLRIAVGEEAIKYDDPVIVEDVTTSGNFMSIGATKATLNISIKDDNATNPGVRYREAGASEWTTKTVTATRASVNRAITITGLKPDTKYEYQAIADGFEPSESKYFTTESKFIIPNASMEEWSNFAENNKVLLPGADGQRTFWDSGNHGSSSMGVTLTQGSEDLKHSGSKSARLRSQFVGLGGSVGKFAAGNIFAGTYVKTDGTNGVLEFGRPYNGSHPSKLKVFANYRPGKVEKGGDYIAVGAMDEAQIYVALTTAPVEIRTNPKNLKLFDPDGDEVLAYGEHTFTAAFGPDGSLEALEIPLDYNAKAKTMKPTHLVIVCAASKYGDYFQGGEGSLMYLDDFELIYE